MNNRFNPYSQGGFYYPPQYYQQQFQSPQSGQVFQQQQAQAAAQPQPALPLYAVNGASEAKAYVVLPASGVYLIDRAGGKLYSKSMDSQGAVTLEEFTLTKEVGESVEQEPIDLSIYATKDELSALTARVDTLSQKLQTPPKRANKGEKEVIESE